MRLPSRGLFSPTFLRSPSGPPPTNGANDQLSSASIFEHVDRMSRGADTSRRLPAKVQLIAMQPMPLPPLHGTPISGKPSDGTQINREVADLNETGQRAAVSHAVCPDVVD